MMGPSIPKNPVFTAKNAVWWEKTRPDGILSL